MKKILKIARREYVETVKTRTFLLSILLTPLLVAGIVFLSIKVQKKSFTGPRPDKHVTVMNLSDEISGELDNVFENYNKNEFQRKIIFKQIIPPNNDIDSSIQNKKDDVRNGTIDGFLYIDRDILEGGGRIQFYTRNVTDMTFISKVQSLVNDAVFNTRCRLNDLSPDLISKIRRRVPVDQFDLSEKTEKKRNEFAIIMVPFFFLFLMFFGIFTISQGLLMSVIEEKTSRVIEVLLAAVSPFQLMTGKILGQSAVGFTLVSLYGFAVYVTVTIRDMDILVNTGIVVYFIIYYVLGFLLISSMLAAVGSACNTIKESQNLMMPIMICFVLPMIVWLPITQHPDDILAVVLSFIPPITPMIMILRIAARPDLSIFQIIASIVLLVVSVPVVMWMSGKIFRTGILMYGKPPSVRELLRWLRYN